MEDAGLAMEPMLGGLGVHQAMVHDVDQHNVTAFTIICVRILSYRGLNFFFS